MQYIKVWLLTIAFIALSLQAAGWNEVERYDLPGYDGSEHISMYEGSYVSYYDAVNGDLMYATNESGIWVVETVDSVGDVGTYSSITRGAITGYSTQGVAISYYDATNGDLKYASKVDGGSWNIEVIDTVGDVGKYSPYG